MPPGAFFRCPSSADCITIMSGSDLRHGQATWVRWSLLATTPSLAIRRLISDRQRSSLEFALSRGLPFSSKRAGRAGSGTGPQVLASAHARARLLPREKLAQFGD